MYKYAIVGFGGLGKVHFKNLMDIERSRDDILLTSICGADRNNLNVKSEINIGTVDLTEVDFTKYNFYDSVDELLDNEELDFVVTALPTIIHAEMAIKIMKHGIHVFSEKPMALSLEDCEKMVEVSKENNVHLMIGQCLRFEPMYNKVKELIDNNTYGRVFRAEFRRYSQMPIWTLNNWILDPKQSGGCPLDMHCHDVDIVNYFFGMPQTVSSVMTNDKVEMESVFSTYKYPDKLVSVNADWSFVQKFPFFSHMLMQFENATVEIKNSELMIYTDTEIIMPQYDDSNLFKNEIEEFVECVVNKRVSCISTGESVKDSVKIVMAEIKSAKTGDVVWI